MSPTCPATHIAAAEPYAGGDAAAWRNVDWSAQERTRVVAGHALRFVDVGAGDIPVLLVHGHGSTWQYWLEAIALLSGHGRRVIAVDLPGFGASQALPFAAASMNGMVAVIAELLDQLAVDRFDVVGHSFGTIVGIELAVAMSDRVNTLTLAGGPATTIVKLFQRPFHTALRHPRLALTVMGDMCTAGLPIPRWARRLFARYSTLRRLAFAPYVAFPRKLAPDLAETLMAGVGAPAYFHLPMKSRDFEPSPVSSIRCRVLLINAGRDAFVPPGDIADFLVAVPHAIGYTIGNAGHLVTVEYPKTFVKLFAEFCAPSATEDCI